MQIQKLVETPKSRVFLTRVFAQVKMSIFQLRNDLQSSTTPPNESQLSHYGRRSMVPEPYLDHKKSYRPFKVPRYRKTTKTVFAEYLLN